MAGFEFWLFITPRSITVAHFKYCLAFEFKPPSYDCGRFRISVGYLQAPEWLLWKVLNLLRLLTNPGNITVAEFEFPSAIYKLQNYYCGWF